MESWTNKHVKIVYKNGSPNLICNWNSKLFHCWPFLLLKYTEIDALLKIESQYSFFGTPETPLISSLTKASAYCMNFVNSLGIAHGQKKYINKFLK